MQFYVNSSILFKNITSSKDLNMKSDRLTVISSRIDSIYPICLFVSFGKPKDDGTVFDSANKRYYLLLSFNGYIICFVCLCTNFLDTSTIHSFHISNVYNLEKSITQTKKDFSKIRLPSCFKQNNSSVIIFWYC